MSEIIIRHRICDLLTQIEKEIENNPEFFLVLQKIRETKELAKCVEPLRPNQDIEKKLREKGVIV
ncbi:MAG: hypothetical protein QXW80_02835 [Candidatus Micrarchaeia archaeon]